MSGTGTEYLKVSDSSLRIYCSKARLISMGFFTVESVCLTENSLNLLVSPTLDRVNNSYLPTFELASVRLRRAIRTRLRLLGPKTTYSELTTCPMRVSPPDL